MKISNLPYEKKRSLAGLLFVLPWIIGFLCFFLRPLYSLVIYSVSDLKIEVGYLETKYTGINNFVSAFTTDVDFLPKLYSNLSGMFSRIPIIICFSLFIAVLLNKKFPGRTLVRTIFFIPVIAGSGGIIMTIMNGDAMSQSVFSGARTSMLFQSVSMQQVLLESGISSDIVSIYADIVDGIFALTWQSGLQIVLFIAALQNISSQLYEAACVEGATAWEMFWNITFPLITPILIVNLIYTIIDFLSDYSNGVTAYIISLSKQLQFSYSSAIAIIYFVMVLVIVTVVYLIVDKFVVYTVN